MNQAQIYEAASDLIGVPYKPRGRDPKGWDCLGCLEYTRKHIFGLDTPDWFHIYSGHEVHRSEVIAEMMATRMIGWVEVEMVPGSALLFSILGAKCHVGTYLGGDMFIHAMKGYDTAIGSVADWTRRKRLAGVYEYRSG